MISERALFEWVVRHRRLLFVVGVLLTGNLWRAGASLGDSAGESTWLNWLVIGVTLYAAFSVLILLPRVAASRDEPFALLLLGPVGSLTPILVAFASHLSGADSWVMPVAFASSAVLLGVSLIRLPYRTTS